MSDTQLIYQRMAKVMQEIIAVPKARENPQQGYKFRGVEDIMNMLQPILARNEIFITSNVIDVQREERTTKSGNNLIYTIVKIEYKFYTVDGSNVSITITGEGMDAGDKSLNKALSAAYKYAMFHSFCIPTEDMEDSETDTPEPSKSKDYFQKIAIDTCKKLMMSDKQINRTVIEIFPDKNTIKEMTEDDWENFITIINDSVSNSLIDKISNLLYRKKINNQPAFTDINDKKLTMFLSKNFCKAPHRNIQNINELTIGEAMAFIYYLEEQ